MKELIEFRLGLLDDAWMHDGGEIWKKKDKRNC